LPFSPLACLVIPVGRETWRRGPAGDTGVVQDGDTPSVLHVL